MRNLLFVCFACAFIHAQAQLPFCADTTYAGSKQHLVSSISPQITLSSTSGEAPFRLHVSAEQTTATGINHPYNQLEFRWDFGDGNANHSFVHPVSQTTLDPNIDQIGPEAVFIYQHPGTYTVKRFSLLHPRPQPIGNYRWLYGGRIWKQLVIAPFLSK